jgi:hypothetical protein
MSRLVAAAVRLPSTTRHTGLARRPKAARKPRAVASHQRKDADNIYNKV